MLWTCSEVQPNEAGALAAVVQALTEGDVSSRQERFAGLSPRASARQSSQVRSDACGGVHVILGSSAASSPPGSSRSAAS